MSAWSPLRHRTFRALWIANLVSGIGSAMHDAGAAWTMGTIADSPALVALMASASSLPFFLLAVLAGALADITDKRRVLIATQVYGLVVAVLLSVCAAKAWLSPSLLLLLTFCLGVGSAFTLPTWAAVVPELVEKDDLPSALALNGIGFNLARAVGPALGGVLVGTAGPAAVFGLNALSFVGILVVLLRWKPPQRPRPSNTEDTLGAVVAGLRFAAHAPELRRVYVRRACFAFAGAAVVSLLPVLARDELRQGPAGYGLILASFGVGAILQAVWFLPDLRARHGADALVRGATLTAAASVLLLAFTTLLPLVLLAVGLFGASWITTLVTLNVSSQSIMPAWVRARTTSIDQLAQTGAIALGGLVWGVVANAFAPTTALASAGVALVLTLALARTHPLPAPRAIDTTPARWDVHHDFAVEPRPEDGPVLITLDYTIAPEREAEFQAVMAELREARLRLGAQRWTLLADLECAGCFRESFWVESWSEHLRQHERGTRSDEALLQAARAFHLGPEPVRVSHLLGRKV